MGARFLLAGLGVTLAAAVPLEGQDRLPIFDAHLHSMAADAQGPPPMAMCVPATAIPAWDPVVPYASTFLEWAKNPSCADPVWSPETDEGVLAGTMEVMERLNVYGVLSSYDEGRRALWMDAAPGRFLPGQAFNVRMTDLTPDSLRRLVASGAVEVLAEVTNQYLGVAPDDSSMDPYWALAEELDLPVGIHIGTGPPGVVHLGSPGHRASLHSALTLEPVLTRHPDLRVYVMHAGWPMIDDMLALMWTYPQVYVDLGGISFFTPDFESYLKRIVKAGFGNRVMFGSDQMVWPGVIERAVERIEAMEFLSEDQKRDIFYNNAARFFRFSESEIARHHGR